jgi:hypothetical protein
MHHPSSSYPCYGYFGIASCGSIWVPERWIHLGHEETLVGTWKQVPLGTSTSKNIENTFQHVQCTMRFPSWATTQQKAGIPRLSNVQTVQTSQGISTACRSCSEGAILQFPLQLFQGGLPQSTRHLGPAKRHAFQLWIMRWETSTLVQWKAPTVPQDPTFEVQNFFGKSQLKKSSQWFDWEAGQDSDDKRRRSAFFSMNPTHDNAYNTIWGFLGSPFNFHTCHSLILLSNKSFLLSLWVLQRNRWCHPRSNHLVPIQRASSFSRRAFGKHQLPSCRHHLERETWLLRILQTVNFLHLQLESTANISRTARIRV